MLLTFIFVTILINNALSQLNPYVDSLNHVLKQANHDTIRIKTLLDLGDFYEVTLPEKAIEYFEQALTIAEQNADNGRRFKELAVVCTRYIGTVHYNQSAFDKAMGYFLRSLSLSEELSMKSAISAALNNIGRIHESLRNFDQAISYFNQSIKVSQEINEDLGVARGYNNLGATYSQSGEIHLSITYFEKAAKLFDKLGLKRYMATTYNNIGIYYLGLIHSKEDSDSTESYYFRAASFFEKAAPVYREMEELYDLSLCLANMAQVYDQINTLLHDMHPKKEWYRKSAIETGTEAIDVARRIKNFRAIYYSAHALRELNKRHKDYKEALRYAEIIIDNNDSIFKQEKLRNTAELEARYKTQKKEQELENQMLVASRQRLLRNTLVVGLVLTILLAASLYRGYLTNRKANDLISKQNHTLEQANAEIMAQRDEVQKQRDMLISQNEILEQAKSHITNSLLYAQSIQAAILPSEKVLESISSDYFVLVKPCELVSGDFFWATHFNHYQVFCVADCTGHGVPGAFMSILGITALNEIIGKHKVVKPSEVLNQLRASVVEALSQNAPMNRHKDGIDIALCLFDTNTRELQFAGAGLHLWIVFKKQEMCNEENNRTRVIEKNGYSLCEVKGDTIPVGYSHRCEPFKNNVIQLNSTSVSIYLATDGYADQFGGENYYKYTSRKLRSLILENCHLPMELQKNILLDEHNRWKANYDQIDDITILGIKV